MKRYFALSLLMVSLAALALADEPPVASPGPARILQAQRNQKLVDKLVDGGLDLARAADRVERAKCCNELARSLAEEIKQAADDHDGDRAVELGRHLQALLKNGVAANLLKERTIVPQGSARESVLRQVSDDSTGITAPLLSDLPETMKENPTALAEVLQAVQEAQASFAGTGKGP
jgi:hypothetical protein